MKRLMWRYISDTDAALARMAPSGQNWWSSPGMSLLQAEGLVSFVSELRDNPRVMRFCTCVRCVRAVGTRDELFQPGDARNVWLQD
jgi:hypothetical protein